MTRSGSNRPRARSCTIARRRAKALEHGRPAGDHPPVLHAGRHRRRHRLQPRGVRRDRAAAASTPRRSARCWSRNRCSAGKSTRWRSCATARTTASSSARSRTSTRWASTPAIRITVAPALTLTDKEYQIMRNASIAVLREIGVDTGGSNVQFAVNPATGRMVVIEMNPRVSRSSALASKATGFPIAKVAAKLAVGYTLDELPNDITGVTPASFEPTIDYVVTKIPRFTFEKFPGAEPLLTTSMKIGRRGDGDRPHLPGIAAEGAALDGDRPDRPQRDRDHRARPTRRRIVARAGAADARPPAGDRPGVPPRPDGRGDPRRLQVRSVVPAPDRGARRRPRSAMRARRPAEGRAGAARAQGDGLLRRAAGRARRHDRGRGRRARAAALGVRPVFKRIDTCAAEFASRTPYMYSSYEGDGRRAGASARPSRPTGARSSSSAAGPTASARASSSTIAASMPPLR